MLIILVFVCYNAILTPILFVVLRQAAVHVGDIFALMIEFYSSQNMLAQAYDAMDAMKRRGLQLAPYLDAKMISAICSAVGKPLMQDGAAASASSSSASPSSQQRRNPEAQQANGFRSDSIEDNDVVNVHGRNLDGLDEYGNVDEPVEELGCED